MNVTSFQHKDTSLDFPVKIKYIEDENTYTIERDGIHEGIRDEFFEVQNIISQLFKESDKETLVQYPEISGIKKDDDCITANISFYTFRSGYAVQVKCKKMAFVKRTERELEAFKDIKQRKRLSYESDMYIAITALDSAVMKYKNHVINADKQTEIPFDKTIDDLVTE